MAARTRRNHTHPVRFAEQPKKSKQQNRRRRVSQVSTEYFRSLVEAAAARAMTGFRGILKFMCFRGIDEELSTKDNETQGRRCHTQESRRPPHSQR
jgi:hypothetical protein